MRTPEKKRNGRWQIRFEDAHRRMRYASFATKREAEARLMELDALRSAGVDPGRRVRFDELVKEWAASHLAHGLRPSTVKHYKEGLARLAAYFGKTEVRTITAASLEKCRNELVALVQAERTAAFDRVLVLDPKLREREAEIRANIQRGGFRAAAKMIGTARMLWKFAVSRGYAAQNVAQFVKKPSAPARVETGVIDQNILNPSEVSLLMEHTPADHRCAVRFLFMTGVRFGEMLGAQWEDMDWSSARILIRRQRSAITGELAAPKTKAGTRWIDLPAELITELKAHRLRTPGDAIFPLDARNWRSRVWHPALRRAGLRSIRIHDARHTHASLLIGSGADIVAVSRRLGHSNPSITLSTYSHAFARRDTAPLGEQLAAFMRRETVGCVLVASGDFAAPQRDSQDEKTNEISRLLVAREGIEPPTRGFSVRCSTN